MTHVSKLMHLIAASLIACAPLISAQTSLHADERINGKLVWQAFEPQRLILQESSAVIYTDGRSRIRKVYGIVVSREGHIVTKASEIVGKKNITLRIGKNVYRATHRSLGNRTLGRPQLRRLGGSSVSASFSRVGPRGSTCE